MPRIQARHLALLVVGLLLVSGSAYAAQSIARNSVGSPQVKNGSLTTKDLKNRSVRGADLGPGAVTGRAVRDRSLRRGDLARNAVTDVRVILRRVEVDAGPSVLFTDPAIGTLSAACFPSQYSVNLTMPATAVPVTGSVTGSDVADTDPAGSASLTANEGSLGGGVGFSGASGTSTLPQGHFYAASRTVALHASWSVSIGSPCQVRMEIAVDRTQPPGFFPRTAARTGRATCTSSGPATCRAR